MTTALGISPSEPTSATDEKNCLAYSTQTVESSGPAALTAVENTGSEAKADTSAAVESTTASKDDSVRDPDIVTEKSVAEDSAPSTSEPISAVASDAAAPIATEDTEENTATVNSKPTTPLKPSEATEAKEEKDQNLETQEAI
ncbi:hypothetical protein EV175_004783, partial [Coemansia sp. RSA 1933]